MADLLEKIRSAQAAAELRALMAGDDVRAARVNAGEEAVLANLRHEGLLDDETK